MSYKSRHRLVEAFGNTFPKKISGTMISRLLNCKYECSYCFPHGHETSNNKWTKDLKCWKRYRKTQYRPRNVGFYF